MLKVSGLLLITFFFSICSYSQGCRPEVCRKRRDVVQGEEVLLHLHGCSGFTKPWVRQVSFCLERSTAEVAFLLKDWYLGAYRTCTSRCAMVQMGTDKESDINSCINCFKESLGTADFIHSGNLTLAEINHCVDTYLQASLSNELPVFEAESNERGRITLPTASPPNNWWSLTVRLPCKPPFFRFWNANCINSFAGDVRARDFVLAQNRLIHSDGIEFLAAFNDACRFKIEDVEIVWDKSVPSFAMPQISSFPSSMPPSNEESGNIFFDSAAFSQLQETDDFDSPEFRSRTTRKKRSARGTEKIREIGIVMPCQVKSFQVSDREGNLLNVTTKGNRHLIQPSLLLNNSHDYLSTDMENLNFTLDFGYDRTSCVFGSSEAKVTPNPSPKFLDENEKITCYTCRSASSEDDCQKLGRKKECKIGEVCQSEVRQVSMEKVSITKLCKQANACENNWKNNIRQCKPGIPASTCRCCCGEDFCNDDALRCT